MEEASTGSSGRPLAAGRAPEAAAAVTASILALGECALKAWREADGDVARCDDAEAAEMGCAAATATLSTMMGLSGVADVVMVAMRLEGLTQCVSV